MLARKAARKLPLLVGLATAVVLTRAPDTLLGALHLSGNPLAASIFEVLAFGYVILSGANILSDGSELLLEILNPGLIGGLVLPVLGALPDALIIAVSGLGGNREEVAKQVAVGLGTLAGSTVMLLTLAWGGSVLAGRCDLDAQGQAVDRTLTRTGDLTATGVTTDADVRPGARIMVLSVLLYGFVQVPAILGDVEDPTAAAIGGGACLVTLVGYCAYQVLVPRLQERKIAAAKRKRQRIFAAAALQEAARSKGSLVDSTGRLRRQAVSSLFARFDTDGDGAVDTGELGAMLEQLEVTTAARLREAEDELRFWLKELDPDADKRITEPEFEAALSRWVREKDAHVADGGRITNSMLASADGGAAAADGSDDEEVDENAEPLTDRQILVRAVAGMAGGLAICGAFSDPLVDALSELSQASGIPAFFVAFVLTPLASNASELLSSLKFAARKRRRNASLTFAQVYGAVTMNNTLCLGLFLLVVSRQRLDWVYSSEVTAIVGVTALIGFIGGTRATIPAWQGAAALALFPGALGLVWGLDTFLGWQ